MAVDRRQAIRADRALQSQKLGTRARSQESAVERAYDNDLAISGNAQLGDLSFSERLAFQAFVGIPPDLGNMHVADRMLNKPRSIQDWPSRDYRVPLFAKAETRTMGHSVRSHLPQRTRRSTRARVDFGLAKSERPMAKGWL